jgi:hypothetical protein
MSTPLNAGKTTFIKNLLAPYAQDPDVKVNNVAGHEALKTFIETPEKMSTTVLVNDHNSLTSFHYRVQETPGEPLLNSFGHSDIPFSADVLGGKQQLFQVCMLTPMHMVNPDYL